MVPPPTRARITTKSRTTSLTNDPLTTRMKARDMPSRLCPNPPSALHPFYGWFLFSRFIELGWPSFAYSPRHPRFSW
uniref:Uncharacterized protein n=2 Tax=Picea TaxID=3328 RepID=A0A101LX80_PICGL|nr:hypothetical protein ABT39_MTgene5993 [Picea glauca]QHR91462.1 hypothetical protein Q903MT_gene5496 [Picea sitchensis]